MSTYSLELLFLKEHPLFKGRERKKGDKLGPNTAQIRLKTSTGDDYPDAGSFTSKAYP